MAVGSWLTEWHAIFGRDHEIVITKFSDLPTVVLYFQLSGDLIEKQIRSRQYSPPQFSFAVAVHSNNKL